MPTATNKKVDFFDTPEGELVRETLHLIEQSDEYVTPPSYTPNTIKYKDNSISFVEKHVAYIRSHPQLDAQHYISNLKLSSRKR